LFGDGKPIIMTHAQRLLRSVSDKPPEVVARALRPRSLVAAMNALEDQSWLDPAVRVLRGTALRLPLGRVRDLLHGVWLGHPLHPALVQVPTGAWLSAGVLDLLPGESRAARRLVALGLATAGPAALAGWVDWADQHEPQQRVGVVHATANITAVALYAGSLVQRLRGRPLTGRLLGFGGLAAVSAGGMLGGHLAYRQAAGANHAEQIPYLVAPGWHLLGGVDEFPVAEAVRRTVGEVPVVAVREPGGTVHVLSDRCSHLSGPLSEGLVTDGCVQCPWHHSMFRLSDGAVVRGPATAPQPAFESRIVGGRVEVRLPGVGEGHRV
jgi:nitrite reductase/ring-hydroxylating ferredoxin subunit